MQRGSGCIRRWKIFQMFSKRRGNRQNQTLAGLACFKSNFASNQIDIVPGEPGEVSKPLSGIEAKENKAFPFIVCKIQNAANLGDREWTPSIVVVLSHSVDKFRWILQKGVERGQSTILDRNLIQAFISRWLFPASVSVLTAGLHCPHFSFEALLRS